MSQKLTTVCETFSSNINEDLNVQNGLLQINNEVSGFPQPPPIFRGDIESIQIKKSLAETPMIVRITWVLSNNFEYRFSYVGPNGYTTYNFYYLSDSNASNTEIKNAIVNWASAMGLVTTTDNTTSVDLTGVAGSPLFNITNLSANLTATSQMGTITPATFVNPTQPQIAGTTTVTVTTAAAQTFKTGDVVTISGFTGPTLTDAYGNTYTSSVTTRIVYATSTTFTLDGFTSNGTANTTSITITRVAQSAYGTADQVSSEVSGYTADATCAYDSIVVSTKQGELKLWLKASLLASPFTATTNLTTFYNAFTAFMSATTNGALTQAKILGLPIS